jgi:signal transduction histidine kinase
MRCNWSFSSIQMKTGRGVRFFFDGFSRAAIALVCAGFSAFVLALCIFGAIHFKRKVEQEYYRQTQNIAQILMAGFDDDAATANSILARLAAELSESDVSEKNEMELHRRLTGYALQPSMIGPGILDRDGTLIASAIVNPAPQISLRDRNIFRFHAETPNETELYISTPMRGSITNEWSIQFSRALRNKSGVLYGVVLLSYRLPHFIRLYEMLKLSDHGLAALTGKDGVVRIRSLNGEIGYGSSVSRIPLVYNRVVAGEKSGTFNSRSGLDDVTRIGTFVVSQSTPFYVTVAYDADYLSTQYIGFFYVLGLCWFVLTAAMVAAAAFVHRLGQLSQQNQLEIVNSTLAERRKISADMHDSIGASLAALLAYFTTENVNIADVRRRIGEVLMELRFLVDSIETDDGDINLLLSNVRHRMGTGIELAGIDLRWQAGELPEIRGLKARDALAIKLALMETLSNVLHHSKARTAMLTANYDQKTSTIFIIVRDDGCGFNPVNFNLGRGLLNMRKRIASISTGGAIVIDSSHGDGTTVRIELKVPPLT